MDTTTTTASTPTHTGAPLGALRSRVLAEHARLKTVIARVDQLATTVAAGDVARLPELRQQAKSLYRMLSEHIDHEEIVLVPVLERIDAWGPVRVEQLKHDHTGQREALEQAASDLDVDGRPLGQAVQSMCWEILHDMRREEHDLLHPDLWRDEMLIVEIGA